VIPDAPPEVLPPSIDDFWREFGDVKAPKHLQKAITALLDKIVLAFYRSNPNVKRSTIQRLVSSAAKNAGAMFNAIPSSPDLTFTDSEFIYVFRHRVGLKPHNDLDDCICGASLNEDTAHFHSCIQLKGAVTARHNRLVVFLANVQVEYRPFGEKRVRPDLLVVLPEVSLFVDVVVSHPAAPSRKSVEPLAMARQAEREKAATYEKLAKEQGARVLAFSVESYGAFGDQATEIIYLIRGALKQGDDAQLIHDQRLPQRLAVVLQKGNALVARAGSVRARRARARLVLQH
jgi:hypothetical protein